MAKNGDKAQEEVGKAMHEHKHKGKYKNRKQAGDEGFDLPSADPQFHDCKRSLHRKVALRHATGMSHPDHFGRLFKALKAKEKAHQAVDSFFG